jgi:hypothetical protein
MQFANVGKVATSSPLKSETSPHPRRGGTLFDCRRPLLQCTNRHLSILSAFLPNGTRFMQERILGKA